MRKIIYLVSILANNLQINNTKLTALSRVLFFWFLLSHLNTVNTIAVKDKIVLRQLQQQSFYIFFLRNTGSIRLCGQ